MNAPRVIAFGECMLELSRNADGSARIAYGGDTLNTALYMARLGGSVAYATALGSDPWSAEFHPAWTAEGLDFSLVLSVADAVTGLYAISTDDGGERTFTYWRDTSPVRKFFRLPGSEAAIEAMRTADLLYLSGITLSLFEDQDRALIADIARHVRQGGGKVAFDPNYRARNWPSPAAARDAIAGFMPLVNWALPTYEDERSLMGDASPEDTVSRWTAAGAEIVVVKDGADGALATDGGSARRFNTRRLQPVDTTGAGDSFNAACLHALLEGADLDQAVSCGHRLAGEVIRRRGAIIDAEHMPHGTDQPEPAPA